MQQRIAQVLASAVLLTGCGDDDAVSEGETDASVDTENEDEDDGGGSSGTAGTGEEPISCTPGVRSFQIPVEVVPSSSGSGTSLTTPAVQGFFSTGPDVELLLAKHVVDTSGDDGVSTALVWANTAGGEGVVGQVPGRFSGLVGLRFGVDAVDTGGVRCALASRSNAGVRFVCEDGTDEAVDPDASSSLVHTVVTAGGVVHGFTQSNSSFTEFRRDEAGVWSEVEKFQSSVSYAGDALSVDGVPLSCFYFETSGLGGLDYGNVEVAELSDALNCKLAYDGETVFVASDTSMVRTSPGVGWVINSVPIVLEGTLLDLFPVDGEPFAVVRPEDLDAPLSIKALPAGPSTSLDLRGATSFDPASKTLLVATVDADRDTMMATVDIHSYCPGA